MQKSQISSLLSQISNLKSIIICSFLFISFMLTAQEKPKKFQWDTATMTELGISEKKQAEVVVLTESLKSELDKVTNDGSLNDEQKKEKRAQLRKDNEKAISGLLSDDEKKKVREMRAKIKAENDK